MPERKAKTSSDDEIAGLDPLAERFDEAWQAGLQPRLSAFAENAGPSQQVLFDLVSIDLEYRLKADEQIRCEDYFRRFPALAADQEACLDLIEFEYCLRLRQAPELSIDEYCRRFPTCSGVLRRRLDSVDPWPNFAKFVSRQPNGKP